MIEDSVLQKIISFVRKIDNNNFDSPKRTNNCDYFEYDFCLYKDDSNSENWVVLSTQDCYVNDTVQDRVINGYIFDKYGNFIENESGNYDFNWIKLNCKKVSNLI